MREVAAGVVVDHVASLFDKSDRDDHSIFAFPSSAPACSRTANALSIHHHHLVVVIHHLLATTLATRFHLAARHSLSHIVSLLWVFRELLFQIFPCIDKRNLKKR